MTREKLYNVVDTVGRTKGACNNGFPVTMEEAKRICAERPWGKPKIVKAPNRCRECGEMLTEAQVALGIREHSGCVK